LGNPKGAVEYAATIDFKFKKDITSNSGKQTRFIILKKESDKSSWRIDSEGTEPLEFNLWLGTNQAASFLEAA